MWILISFCPALAIEETNGTYIVGTAQELAEVASMIDKGNAKLKAILTADIDFRSYPTTMLGSTTRYPFQGDFDGNGHVITLGINTTETGDYSGALIRFAHNATVRNLQIEGSVSTCGKHCASLISYASGTCSITNVVSSANLSSSSHDDCIGGFIGIAGENFDRNSTNITFTNCAFTGSITYTGVDIAGKNSIGRFAHHGGGFVGWKGVSNSRVYLINCFSAPRELQQSANFHPFVRYWPYKDVGIVCLQNCYYASNITDYGKSTLLDQSQGHPLPLADFHNGHLCELLNQGNSVPAWRQKDGSDYYPLPTFSKPDSTIHTITSADELEAFALLVSTTNPYAKAVLGADIDYRSHTSSVGNEEHPFMGFFEGNNHSILVNFSFTPINALFGCVGPEGIVKNLQVNGTITTSSPYAVAGGIVGHLNGGYVLECHSMVDITVIGDGQPITGGIVGEGDGMALISNCVFSGSITTSHSPRAGYILGTALDMPTYPTVFIRNSIVFQPAEKLQGASTLPLYNGLKHQVHADEAFCLVKEDFYPAPTSGPKMYQLSNGDIFQIIWDRQIMSDKKTIDEQEYLIKRTHLTLLFVGLLSLLIIITLLAITQSLKVKHLLLQRSFDNAIRQLEQWEESMRQARETKDSNKGICKDESKTNNTPGSAQHNSEKIKLHALYDRILLLMDEQQLYRLDDLNEPRLARELGTNVKYLSQCIQQCSNQSNFNAWLASYRINHALQQISANPFIDVMSVCHDSGFASHSTFNRHFKNIVGMTAQQYIKMVQNNSAHSS